MIIDSHHHFWEMSRFSYPWMDQVDRALKKDYLPDDLIPLLSRNGIHHTVIVQAHQSVDETLWLLDLAAQNDFVAGVVGWVDLADSRVGETLDELMKHPHFKGVRHVWHDEPDDAWILQPAIIRGLNELAKRDIPFDFLTFPRHLKYIPQVCELVPDLRAVVDHISKPPIWSRKTEPWRNALKTVAEIPNMHCKLSGMVTEADHRAWCVDDLKPYVDTVVELFGYERLLFGSDWPVCTLAASYDQVLNAALDSLGQISEPAKIAVLGANAERFYGL